MISSLTVSEQFLFLFVSVPSWSALTDGGNSFYRFDTLEPAAGQEHSQNTDLIFVFCSYFAREHRVVVRQTRVSGWPGLSLGRSCVGLDLTAGGKGDRPWWGCPTVPRHAVGPAPSARLIWRLLVHHAVADWGRFLYSWLVLSHNALVWKHRMGEKLWGSLLLLGRGAASWASLRRTNSFYTL